MKIINLGYVRNLSRIEGHAWILYFSTITSNKDEHGNLAQRRFSMSGIVHRNTRSRCIDKETETPRNLLRNFISFSLEKFMCCYS